MFRRPKLISKIVNKQLVNGKNQDSKTHFCFTNMGSKMHIFRVTAIWSSKFWYRTPYIFLFSLKPTVSPEHSSPLSPPSSKRGIRRQATAYNESIGQTSATSADSQSAAQSQTLPMKSGWSASNPNLPLTADLGQNSPNRSQNSQNLTKRVKLAKATKVGRWTSVQSGHYLFHELRSQQISVPLI